MLALEGSSRHSNVSLPAEVKRVYSRQGVLYPPQTASPSLHFVVPGEQGWPTCYRNPAICDKEGRPGPKEGWMSTPGLAALLLTERVAPRSPLRNETPTTSRPRPPYSSSPGTGPPEALSAASLAGRIRCPVSKRDRPASVRDLRSFPRLLSYHLYHISSFRPLSRGAKGKESPCSES